MFTETVNAEESTTNNNIPLNLIERTYLYDSPSLAEQPVASLSAQDVIAKEQQGDWYLINTWIGPKWIKPNLPTKSDYQSIILTVRTNLYAKPSTADGKVSSLSPQDVSIVAESGDGWYQVNTWLGPMWINPEKYIHPISEEFDLAKRVYFYNEPATNQNAVSSLSPQSVTAVAKLTGSSWYQINTWIGPKWVNLSKGSYAVPTNEEIVLKHRTTLYDSYNKSNPVSSVAPQTVTAVKKIEGTGWYQINTWLGPKWIQLGSLSGKVIVLDPGHGGFDPGAIGRAYGTFEKNINLSTAKYLYNYLKDAGANVVLTRNNDTFISLSGRVSISHMYDADAFVSIHYNSSVSGYPNGIMTLYGSSSKDLGLARAVHSELISVTGLENEGVHYQDLHVLRENKNTSILVELGFLSNSTEERTIRTSTYQNKAALGIYRGLEKYFSK
jgi:N-acetylmuramoyl-L-alanine amidase